jgi:hypothetical protein
MAPQYVSMKMNVKWAATLVIHQPNAGTLLAATSVTVVTNSSAQEVIISLPTTTKTLKINQFLIYNFIFRMSCEWSGSR